MMAETRATNRAIRKLIAMKLWEDVEKRLAKEKIDEAEKAKIMEVGKSSYEEMNNENKEKAPTDENSVKNMALAAIDRCNDVDKLLDLIERVKKNKEYKEEIKREIIEKANRKANTLADLQALNE